MKIGIVGSGFVGSTAAYAMIMRGVGREIVLVDKNEARASAEAYDLLHAVPFSNPLRVRHGGYADLAESRLVILSAGVSQRPGETRMDLLKRNAVVFRDVIPKVFESDPKAILVVATNPLDVMTHVAADIAARFGVSKERIIGTGTMLDTARFRTLLGGYLGVDAQHVHAYVVGEHGDTEVLTWSLISVSGMPLQDFCRRQGIVLNEQLQQEIDQQVRKAAYHIIEGKGATYYGIGGALAKLADVILHDQRSILTVSSRTDVVAGVSDVSVSVPCLIGGEGIITLIPLPLNDQEQAGLEKSARAVREAIDEVIS